MTVPAGHGAGTGITGLAADGSGLIAVRPGTAGDAVTSFPERANLALFGHPRSGRRVHAQVVKGSAYGFAVTGTDADAELRGLHRRG